MRFPEFKGEWEKCVISDFGTVITGNTPPTKDISNYKNGQKLWASPADLGKSKWVYTTQTKLSLAGFEKTRKLPNGAILITCIGSTIGKMGMATNEMSTNQQINSIITNPFNDNDFVYYAIESRFPKYLTSIAVQAVPIISKSSFEQLPNNKTSLEEQRKIGKLLSLIDKRIETQNKIIEKLESLIKIIEKLESLIKGIVQNITLHNKPNVRISECLECTSSTLQESDALGYGTYPVYGANGIVGYLDNYNTQSEAIYIIKDGSGVGAVSYVTGKCSATGTLSILQAKKGHSLQYLYYLLKVFNFEPYKTGMAIPHIYFKDYSKTWIFCPSYSEQLRYAKLLSAIDGKLLIEQKILKRLNLQRKYLLRQMFI